LLSLRDHQISLQAYGAFKATRGPSLEVLEAESAARDLAPGQKTTGVISFTATQDSAPQLYQLNFGNDQDQSLTVAAVL
jgi:hypothetical protein